MPEVVVFLQATSPVRSSDAIQEALDHFHEQDADSLFSAGPFHGFLWRVEADGVHALNYNHRHRPRRQDAPEDLVENGSIYIFKPWVLREMDNRLGGKIAVYRMSAAESLQIDEPEDLALVEHLLRTRQRENGVDLSQVQLLVLDFDGVLTDNRVLVNEDGIEGVLAHRGDGWGIARVREHGVEVMILSTEANPVVTARARKLQITCTQNCDDKLTALQEEASRRNLRREQIAFVGNDLNDLAVMQWVGTPIAVADAVEEVRACARLVTRQRGGFGAVREVCDAIIKQKQEVTHARTNSDR